MRSNSSYSQVAMAALELGRQLPREQMLAIAESIGDADWTCYEVAKSSIVRSVPHGIQRRHVSDFIELWVSASEELCPSTAVMALVTAVEAHEDASLPSVELVWTGPDAGVVPIRHTEQALLQLIRSATDKLLVVSYAVYSIPRISDALTEASGRGVTARIILETPSPKEGEEAYNTIQALGDEVAAHCDIYVWPLSSRETDTNRRPGILHVKAASADGTRLLISSANLTEYAFTINMELGIMITGGPLPQQVEDHFDRMIETGIIVPVSTNQ